MAEDFEAENRSKILDMARQHESEGDLELDDDAVISLGDDNGAYVQMWKWVDFAGTELCRDEKCDDPDCKKHGG